jgi:hypothetical protein
LIKYGESSRVLERDIVDHRKTYGNQFKIIHIRITDNKNVVEKKFESVIKAKKINISLNFDGKQRKELFTLSNTFTIDDAIKLMDDLVDKYQSSTLKDKDNKIRTLEYQLSSNPTLCVEQEKTKQEEIRLKQKEAEIELAKIMNQRITVLAEHYVKSNIIFSDFMKIGLYANYSEYNKNTITFGKNINTIKKNKCTS